MHVNGEHGIVRPNPSPNCNPNGNPNGQFPVNVGADGRLLLFVAV